MAALSSPCYIKMKDNLFKYQDDGCGPVIGIIISNEKLCPIQNAHFAF
jgi:hypothetical protein